jgi:hypothetical protein
MSEPTQTPPTPAAAPAVTPPAAPPEPAKAPPPVAAKGKAPAEPPKPAAEPTQEPPKAEEKPKPKADDWAKLSAAEKRIRAEREKVETRAKELAEREKALESTRSLIEKAKGGDWEAREKLLAETGLTYDELTKRKLSGGKVDKAEEVAKELEKLKAEMAARETKAAQDFEENTIAQNLDACVTFATKEAATEHPILAGEIAENPDWVSTVMRSAIAAIVKNGGRDERGNPMTVKDATARLETHLRTEAEKRIARLRPPQPPAPPPAAAEPTTSNETRPRDQAGRFAGGDGPRRLNNGISAERSSAPLPATDRARPRTQRERDQEERERLKRAAAALPRR